MKKIIIKPLDKIIVLLLFVFGIFNSCDKDGEIVPEYGVPKPRNDGKNIILNKETIDLIQNVSVINEID